jgi:sporulation protein YhbH
LADGAARDVIDSELTMVLKIEKDHQRFRQIVKGRIREDLRKFLTRGELIGKEGKHLISIPVRGIELPHFRYGDNSQGIGAGDGKEGETVGKGQPGGKSQGGTEAGAHIMEVDLSLDELAEILGEELKLPRIEPKGKHRITTTRDKYSSLRRVGPESLRHFKRSFKEALKRQIMLGDYDPDNPVIIPQKKDIRYRSWKEIKSPQSNALIVFMMDVSGSMGEEQKELVRLESFWIDTWLRKNYEGIESRYIVHDVSAKEVDKHTFYHLREDGGTKISSAFKTAKGLLDQHYSPDEWNIYLFHFSDGDNSSEADSRDCVKLLKEQLLPICNMFGYCQVASAYGSGNFINVLHEHLRNHEKVLTSRVNSKDDIYDSIKTFFGKGH